MVGKKLFILLIISFFFTNNYFSNIRMQVNADSSSFNIDQRKSDQAKLTSRKKSLESALKENQKKIVDKKQQYDNVNNQIIQVKEQKVTINKNIKELEYKVSNIKREIEEKAKQIKENTEILKKRLVSVYKAGEVNLIDLIFNAKTFEEFIDKAEIISKVSEHDNKLLTSLKNSVESLENMKKSLLDNQAKLENERNSLTSTESQLQELLNENTAILKQLNGEQAVFQAEIDESDAEYQRIQKEINDYLEKEKQRKLFEESQKKEKKDPKIKKLSTNSKADSEEGRAWPVPSCRRLSSKHNEKRGNKFHKGIDIAGDKIYGKDVIAVDKGVVISSFGGCKHDYGKLRSCGCGGGYGNYVIIAHAKGKISIYGHLSVVCTTKGKKVKKGEKIGEVGTTGYSTGPHLHFQTKNNGVDYNPLDDY